MRFLLLLLTNLLFQIAGAQVLNNGAPDAVTTHRSQTIKNVSYDLIFNIPTDKKLPVTGTATVSFYLQKKEEVVLDFEGRFSGACIINGKKRVAAMRNNHIIIPQKQTKKGLNTIEMNFVSKSQGLCRGNDYLYALLDPSKASSCFPCFDQSDLQATFTTQLNMPEGWLGTASSSKMPIPPDQYGFVAGQFEEATIQRHGYNIHVLHHEQEQQRVKQLPRILDETATALHWMESYTGIKYPLETLDIVILPGYDTNDMETPGVMMTSAQRVFLKERPERNEQLERMTQIAHKVAHQWFGSMVTFQRTEEAKTEEEIVDFMAAKIARTQFTKTDIGLNLMKHDNTPAMMGAMEDVIGQKQLQAGLQHYLRTYYMKNSSWEDFIRLLDQENPSADVKPFYKMWGKQNGRPVIHTTYNDGQLIVSQTDPSGRGRFWRQKFDIRIIYDLDRSRTITIDMTQPTVAVKLARQPSSIIPNYSGRGYGRFTLDKAFTEKLPLRLIVTRGDLQRYALLQTLYDNYQMGRIPPSYFGELYRTMIKEKNAVIIETAIDHMFEIAFNHPYAERQTLEQCMMDLLPENHSVSCRLAILRKLGQNAISPEVLAQLYQIWDTQSDRLLDEYDYMQIAYRLALIYQGQWQTIIDRQKSRLSDDYLKQEFAYVSKACNPDQQTQHALFNHILKAENRQRESWALQALELLNADIREPQSNVYVSASLNSLPYLKQTSDDYFTSKWLQTLLKRHKSREARQLVDNYASKHPQWASLLSEIR